MSEITQAQKTALLKLPGFKEIQKQYAKENQAGAGKRGMKGKGRMKGKGFWQDAYNWFENAGKDINQFLKDSKIVSNVAAYALPILGSMGAALLTANPLGAVAGGIAGKSTADYIRSQGYGHMDMKGSGYVNKLSQVGTGIVFNRGGLIQDQQTTRLKGGGMRGGDYYDTLEMFAPLAGVSLRNLAIVQKQLKGGAMRSNTAAIPTSTTYNSVYSQASGKIRM